MPEKVSNTSKRVKITVLTASYYLTQKSLSTAIIIKSYYAYMHVIFLWISENPWIFSPQFTDFRKSSMYCFVEIYDFSPSMSFNSTNCPCIVLWKSTIILPLFLGIQRISFSVFWIPFIVKRTVWVALATQPCISITQQISVMYHSAQGLKR